MAQDSKGNVRARSSRPHEAPMSDPLAFLLTWTTYGTWLPGDERGWVKRGKGYQLPNPRRKQNAMRSMTESACRLDPEQRALVEKTITDHCEIRGWHLYAINCRTNHVHVVVAADMDPEDIGEQFRAWCTRKLNELQRSRSQPTRENWWTERGSGRHLDDEESLEWAILYVRDTQ
jgi:REP element-mobilizing transposase RayT